MAEGTFTIQELKRVGGTTTETSDGEKFSWTSNRQPDADVRGGARACPRNGWMMSGQLRTVRTDYPGAKTPSEQVLGPNHLPFTLNGRWDDRYNFPGYAIEEKRRFEAMCRRGNLCRFQFQNQAFEGIIKNWKFNYKREWYITYSFTVSVHDRPEDVDNNRSPATPRTPQDVVDDMLVLQEALKTANLNAPNAAFDSSNAKDLTDAIALAMDEKIAKVGDSIDAADAGSFTDSVVGVLSTVSDSISGAADEVVGFSNARSFNNFKRVATQFRDIRSSCLEMVDSLIQVRSDTELAVRTALNVLDFESWSRSLRYNARLINGEASKGAKEIEERDEPEALRVYRPQAGESLYKISRRFYGTPHAWRLIADRNGLSDATLSGNETLIIPERGEGG